ncbi:MAG: thiamine diphosphokinase [Ignavibacteria bacterium]|nr:thiamine diphosphokinase [Ignavibacteria bacterium]
MQASIFLNGKLPSRKVIKKLLEADSLIIGADGGGNLLHKMNIIPGAVIGDMDSISTDSIAFFRKSGVKVLHLREQETTDFEKCLMFCCKKGVNKALVFGATSMRPDHTLNNFSVMKRYKSGMAISLITEEYEIFFAEKHLEFSYPNGENFSMLGMPVARSVTTSGLQYRLKNEDLIFGEKEGSLNKSVSDTVIVNHKGGDLLVFRKHFLN